MRIIGIESAGAGTNNQIRGIILEGSKSRAKGEALPVTRQELLKASDGRILNPKNFSSLDEFETAVQQAVTDYLKKERAPEFVVLPFEHAAFKGQENNHVDILSHAVKKAFASHGKQVNTIVLTSNLYDYEYVDLIHVGKHLLTNVDEQTLVGNPQLKSRVVETLGVPSNLSWLRINNEANQPQLKSIIDKYRGQKNVLFSLGGKTDNGAIKFEQKDAEELVKTAIYLKSHGYNVIFVNSPRTPNEVTDYLYEKCRDKGLSFFNSKKVATTEEERKNFRIYTGKYEAEFAKQMETLGNIYPAILSLFQSEKNGTYKGFVVNTHDSFSYTSDAAVLGIPSVVYTGNEIDQSRPDCHKLFKLCAERGHVMDLATAVRNIITKKPIQTKPMEDVSSQLVRAMERQLPHERTKIVTRDSGQYS